MIAELQAAKAQDEKNVADPATDIAEVGDSEEQAQKADRALREMKSGYKVSQEEFADAIMVPPATISPEEKTELIRKLEKVKSYDEQIVPPLNGEGIREGELRQHEETVDAVIKDLRIGDDVSWSQIQRALTPPKI